MDVCWFNSVARWPKRPKALITCHAECHCVELTFSTDNFSLIIIRNTSLVYFHLFSCTLDFNSIIDTNQIILFIHSFISSIFCLQQPNRFWVVIFLKKINFLGDAGALCRGSSLTSLLFKPTLFFLPWSS